MYKYRVVFSEIYKEFWVQNVPKENRKDLPQVETNGTFTAISAENLERVQFLVEELTNRNFKRDCLLDEIINIKK